MQTALAVIKTVFAKQMCINRTKKAVLCLFLKIEPCLSQRNDAKQLTLIKTTCEIMLRHSLFEEFHGKTAPELASLSISVYFNTWRLSASFDYC